MSNSLKVTDSRRFRAVTFLPHGQRMELWLPVGEYVVEGDCLLSEGREHSDPRSREGGQMIPARKLRDSKANHWYIGQSVPLD